MATRSPAGMTLISITWVRINRYYEQQITAQDAFYGLLRIV